VAGVGSDSRQGDAVFAEILRSMGAEVVQGPDWTQVGSGDLVGVDVDLRDASDIAQTLAVVAAVAKGRTRVRGIGFIRAKETDRIAAVVRELRRVGIDAVEDEDGFTVEGGRPHGGVVRTYGDHRMAMSFALLSLCTPGIVIEDPGCVDKTYPDYFADLASLIGAGPTTMASDP
jgi:3-phosphoshikimate 1-carboxyvinyltransferase